MNDGFKNKVIRYHDKVGVKSEIWKYFQSISSIHPDHSLQLN